MISDSILQTLRYSDHFGFPLTLKEIHLRLINVDQLAKDRSELPQEFGSLSGLQQAIKKLIIQNQIEKSSDYYHLPGHKSLVSRRLKRAKLSASQLVRASSLAGKLSTISGVIAIYLTGSLALSNTEGADDIDLMIITAPGRLWTTRFLLTLYTEFLGLRRRPKDRNPSGKLCLNLYLTPDSYFLPISKQNLYTAYELIQAVPLYDPADTHTSLLAANSWITQYLPNVPRRTLLKRNSRLQAEKGPAAAGRRVLNGTLQFFEFLLYHLQLFYMHPKLTREYITPNSAFFHPHNPAPKV